MSEDKRLNEVIRVQKSKNNFVTMDKEFLENGSLSWKAKGILAYLLSKPDNWKVIASNLVNSATDGKGSVYKGLKELSEWGYYEKTPIRDEKGVIVRWDSVVLEVPNAESLDISGVYPLPKNQEVDNQEMDYPYMENRTLIKNYINNNKFNNNQSSQVRSETDGQDTTEVIEAYTEMLKQNIRYSDLIQTNSGDIKLVDEMILIMLDAIITNAETVRIGKEDKSIALVKSVLMKLTYEDIEHVIWQYKSVTERIAKKKQYILTMLYNSKMENTANLVNKLPLQYR